MVAIIFSSTVDAITVKLNEYLDASDPWDEEGYDEDAGYSFVKYVSFIQYAIAILVFSLLLLVNLSLFQLLRQQ